MALVVGLLEANTDTPAYTDHKLHTYVPTLAHIVVLVVAATGSTMVTNRLSCHPDHPSGPVVMASEPDHDLSAITEDDVGGAISREEEVTLL